MQNPAPLVTGGDAVLNSVDSASFTLQFLRAGTATVKLHASSLWQTNSTSACIEANPDGWLHIHDTRAEGITVTAAITMGALIHRTEPYCKSP